MKVSKGDFVKVEYVGRVKVTEAVFDLTDEELAKKEGIHRDDYSYGPRIVSIGSGHLLAGLEEKLVGIEMGKKKTVELTEADGFGPRNPDHIKVFPKNAFKGQKTPIVPGARIMVQGMPGTISAVSGGRVRVDFNHPLAGKDLVYEIKVLEKVTNKKDQVSALLDLHYGKADFGIKITGKEIEIKVPNNIKDTWVRAKPAVLSDLFNLIGLDKVQFVEEFSKPSLKK